MDVSSTRPYAARPRCRRASDVSIHAPVRGATRPGAGSRESFNPRARTGRDQLASQTRGVSIHAPVRGATGTLSCTFHCGVPAIGFNPRARTGRDGCSPRQCTSGSIHAPVRGATPARSFTVQLFQSTRPYGARPPGQDRRCKRRRVSIHAPVRGATSAGIPCSPRSLFQSTRPYGARPHRYGVTWQSLLVSIHAPVRGATIVSRCGLSSVKFQSTRPYGARQPWATWIMWGWSFNPRARTGRDFS